MSLSVKQQGVFSFKNKQLAYQLDLPEGKGPFAFLLCCHGFAGSKEGSNQLYLQLGPELAAKKVGFLSFDFRGSGSSSHELKDLELDDFLEDINDVFHALEELPFVDAGQIYLLGNSFGGMLSCLSGLTLASKIKKLALLAPVAYGKTWADLYQDILDKSQPNDLVTFYQHRLKACFAEKFLKAQADLALAKYYPNTPVLLLFANSDEVIPEDHAQAYAKARESANASTTIVSLENADHAFSGDFLKKQVINHLVNFFH